MTALSVKKPAVGKGALPGAHRLHAGIAEQGKVLALRGRHQEALVCYQEALRLAETAGAPQIVARHYLHCVLDSLEHMGAFRDAAQLCARALDQLPSEAASLFHAQDRACLLERKGVAELSAGLPEDARSTLAAAVAAAAPRRLPLAEQVLDWLDRGYSVTPTRLADLQRRSRYFVVRPDSVDPRRALALPLASKRSDGWPTLGT